MSDSALTVTHVRNEIQKLLINYYTKTQIYPKKHNNYNSGKTHGLNQKVQDFDLITKQLRRSKRI